MFRAAVVGTGRMGNRHIEAIRQMKNLELVGVCDTNPENLCQTAENLELETSLLFRDAKKMAVEIKPDLVIIATTAPSHCQLTTLFVENEAEYILCEKPMAISLEECERMIEVCRSENCHLAINHQRRYMPRVMLPKEIFTKDSFGELKSINQIGGNLGMAMNAIHSLELFEYLTGEPVSVVSAWFSDEIVPNPRGAQFIDRAGNLMARTQTGKRLNIEIGADQGHGLLTTYVGCFGYLTIDEIQGDCRLSIRKAGYRDNPTSQYSCPADIEMFNIEPGNLVDATCNLLGALIRNEDFPNGKSGQNAVAALVAAYLSNENQHAFISVSDTYEYKARKFSWA